MLQKILGASLRQGIMVQSNNFFSCSLCLVIMALFFGGAQNFINFPSATDVFVSYFLWVVNAIKMKYAKYQVYGYPFKLASAMCNEHYIEVWISFVHFVTSLILVIVCLSFCVEHTISV